MNNTLEKVQTKPKQKIIGSVFETYNYDMFKTLDGNRDTNKAHINKLVKSISEKYAISPIIVNGEYAIIDGQHRYEAVKILELPVRYIIDTSASLRDVQLLNAKNKNWNPGDYVDSYIKLGNEEYKTYKAFKDFTGFAHHSCLSLLSTRWGGKINEEFKDGKLKINRLDHAYSVFEVISKCKPLYEGYNRRGFIAAISKVMLNEKFKADVFIKKLSAQRSKMYDCGKTSQYVELIEIIYNYRNKNKVNLRI